MKGKKKNGRPSKFTEELGDEICARITEGESLNKICKEEDKPSLVTIFAWMRVHPEFLNNYTRAREEQAETFADEIINIADSEISRDVFGRIDAAAVNHARLRVDARKWIASKLKPKKYGDSTTLRGDNDAPLNPSVNVILNK